MALSPGTRVGQHEITDAIGAGGMGEVYRDRFRPKAAIRKPVVVHESFRGG